MTATPPSTSTTNATGIVVDDANGNPLQGVSVKLMPWAPCGPTPAPSAITPENDGCPTPLPSPQATTNAQGQFTLNGAPNGHYLLVIGADAVATVPPGYVQPTCINACPSPTPLPLTIQATVHDNVTLSGGNQTLEAPKIANVPLGYTAAQWETNGDYRLAKLDQTAEVPCYIAFNYDRQQNGEPGASIDEWLIENERSEIAYDVANGPNTTVTLLTTGNVGASGGSSCAVDGVQPAFQATNTSTYAENFRTLWFGGGYNLYVIATTNFYQGFGLTEFPPDPRSFVDPNVPSWP